MAIVRTTTAVIATAIAAGVHRTCFFGGRAGSVDCHDGISFEVESISRSFRSSTPDVAASSRSRMIWFDNNSGSIVIFLGDPGSAKLFHWLVGVSVGLS